MRLANCQIRQDPHYRRQAFEAGLRKSGYQLVTSGTPSSPEDLLVIWNRYGPFNVMANAWEARGGTVLVCENGYVGKDDTGHQYYAISAKGHNGSGWWPTGTYDRFEKLHLVVQDWKPNDDGHMLICGQRGIGSPSMASPPDWHKSVEPKIRVAYKNNPIRTRLHPGGNAPTTPLEDDLRGAKACVIWSSSSGVKSLLLGVPVIYDAPHWICAESATKIAEQKIDYPDNRLDTFRKMAWAQWSVKEIEEGIPFALFIEELGRRTK